MSINSINTIDKVNCSENIGTVSTLQEEEELFGNNTDLGNQDTIEIQEKETVAQELDLRDELNKTREEQGLIGNIWDGFKNLFNIGASSNKAEEAINKYEAGEISKEEAQEALNAYKDGQDMAVNITANILSGIAVGIFAPMIASTPLGIIGVAAVAGSALKVGIKSGEAAIGGKDYTAKDLCYDTITGFINGAFSPITGGLAGAASNTVARTCGYKAVESSVKNMGSNILAKVLSQSTVKYVAEEGAKTGLRTVGGLAATLTVNGTMGGGVDTVASAIGNTVSNTIPEDFEDNGAGNINQEISKEDNNATEIAQEENEELALSA